MSLNITEDKYSRIKTAIGYPITDVTDFGLTDDQVKDLFILPVLKELYFRFFPIITEYKVGASSSFSVDFPSESVFSVTDVRLVTRRYTAGIRTESPLVNDLNIIVSKGKYRGGMYGTRFDYGTSGARIAQESVRQSYTDYNKAVRYKVDFANRKVTGYTNIVGDISIKFAHFSENFDDIKFERIEDTIQLCQARLLRFLGQLLSNDNSGIPNEINAGEFVDRADKIEDVVLERWRNFTRPVIIRN